MKIGQLAKLCGVSVATIRYYVSMGMLIPNDSSAQYDFSEREVEDLNLILKMRKHQFKLKEIQQYLILTRHSRMIEPSTINAALTILETKQQEIFSEIDELKNSYREIGEEIHNLREKGTAERRVTGVPVSALPLFACPYCGESLNIEDVEIKNGYIISGNSCVPVMGMERVKRNMKRRSLTGSWRPEIFTPESMIIRISSADCTGIWDRNSAFISRDAMTV